MRGERDWIQTYTGKKFFPLDPQPEEICIEDIAQGLSLACRFAGQISQFYSVAQHSVLVSNLVPSGMQLEGLLHDAAEAYIADICHPIKKHLPDYKVLTVGIEKAIAAKFGFPYPMSPQIHSIDRRICIDEANALLPGGRLAPESEAWSCTEGPLNIAIFPWSAETARSAFLAAFRLCCGGNGG